MRPLKVVISAFGPYKDEVEIDFEKLGSNGIFLITGDTGSGKTTIFDAISFALYGVSSGNRRENSSFRSDFASDNIKTFVKLLFIHKGIIYNVERSPRYYRKKLRGDGVTLVGGDATLTFLNEVITGDKIVSDKCIEILGINANQFKQIVMIAQGEFMELLHAKPKDRSIIFRKIFDTNIYKKISDKLKDEYNLKRQEFDKKQAILENYKNNFIGDIKLNEQLDIGFMLDKYLEYIEFTKLEEDNLKKQKKVLDAEFIYLLNMIKEGSLINDSIDELAKVKLEFDKLNKNQSFYKEKEIILKKNKDIIMFIKPKYDIYINLKNKLGEKKDKIKESKEKINEIIDRFNDIEDKYKNIFVLEKELEQLNKEKNILEEKINLLDDKKKLEKELKEKENIYNLILLKESKDIVKEFDDCSILKNKLSLLENEYNQLKDLYKEQSIIYLNAYEQFLDSQAGILATTLIVGKPCPVCGSLEHPNPSIVVDEVLSREEINFLKLNVDEISINIEKKLVAINNLKSDIEVLKRSLFNYDYEELLDKIKNLENKVINNNDIEINDYKKNDLEKEIVILEGVIGDKFKNFENIDINKIKLEMDEVLKNIGCLSGEINKIKDEYQYYSVEKEKNIVLVNTFEEEISSLEQEVMSADNNYIDAYNKYGYESEDEYLSIIISDEDVLALENDINKYNEDVLLYKGRIVSLEDFLENKKKVNINEFLERKVILEDKINNIDVYLKELNYKILNNLNIYNKMKKLYIDLSKLEKDVMIYKDLSDTANGSIVGKNKLEFEHYVQSRYFDRVIAVCNKRFNYMTDERYLLVRREESSKISDKLGLELEVIDNYTGKRRDIKTLSGGESFKAALSLALGMSDVIQEFAGGIVVDAMFIDEGFGSLDSDSLESAMNAIMMLGNNDKIIGIISHVDELKQRIDKKIIVNKGSSGSSVSISI